MSNKSSLYGVVITKMHRLPNSLNGNPKWRLHLRDHDGREQIRETLKDTSVALRLGPYWEGRTVDVLTDGRGAVVDIIEKKEPADVG